MLRRGLWSARRVVFPLGTASKQAICKSLLAPMAEVQDPCDLCKYLQYICIFPPNPLVATKHGPTPTRPPNHEGVGSTPYSTKPQPQPQFSGHATSAISCTCMWGSHLPNPRTREQAWVIFFHQGWVRVTYHVPTFPLPTPTPWLMGPTSSTSLLIHPMVHST